MNYQELFKNVNVANMVEPARRYNALVMDHAEKLVSMQLDAARSYADLGIKQLRDIMEINDAKTLQDYLGNQAGVAKTVAERAQQDVRNLAEMGQSFASELQSLVQENASSVSARSKPARSKTPSNAGTAASSTASEGSARKSA